MKKRRRVLLASIIGNGLELYDFTLYGIFTPAFAILFFPSSDPNAALLAGLIALAVGYFARPLGAAVFGHVGDRIGRKKALSLSIVLMAFATTGIGLLPTYAAIGFLAPLTLVLCRLLQGFCAGGEMNGAAIFLLEHSNQRQANLASALVFLVGGLGSLLAALSGGIFLRPSIPEWGWRIPFILGGIVGLIGLYIRYQVDESPEFQEKAIKDILKHPLRTAIMQYPLSLMRCLACGGLSGALAATLMVYMSIYLTKVAGISISDAPLFTTFGLAIYILLSLCVGLSANKIGRIHIMRAGSIGIIVGAYPVFYLAQTGQVPNIMAAEVIIATCGACFVAPLNAFMNELLPVNMRYSGVATSYSIGFALCGGMMPVIATFLLNITENSFSPALYLIVIGFIGSMSTFNFKPVALGPHREAWSK
jgi:MHS family proline/betaine transporter-like MFS transporter